MAEKKKKKLGMRQGKKSMAKVENVREHLQRQI